MLLYRQLKRRRFLLSLASLASVSILPWPVVSEASSASSFRFLRPPGVSDEESFLTQCIHCGQCGEICPNRAINYFSLENGLSSLGTPFIIPREQACILCMKCGDICPSGALKAIPREQKAIVSQVRMGKAHVDKSLCLSYQGKTCGVCYRACPLADVAIKVGMLEQPEVLDDCVGCGLCERACIQMPQAIRIRPANT